MSIRIVLADDHDVMRHGLCQALQQEKDMEIVGQAGDGRTAIRMAGQLRPDVMLMDIGMPDLNGIEATREIHRETPGVKVIALSMHSTPGPITEMFRAGASGYLPKNCDFAELVRAIRIVVDGQTYVSPSISKMFVNGLVHPPERAESTAFSLLTQREREVLQLLAEGRTTKEIARQLHISPKTVEMHRLRLMNKLGIDHIATLTKYAIQEGLTSAEP